MKWYAIPAKYDLWFVFVLAGLGWAAIGGTYLYLAEPYLVFEEQRVSDEPETIKVEYRAGDCAAPSGAPCILSRFQTSTSETKEDADGVRHTTTAWSDVIFALLEGVPCPEYSDLTVEGNEFLVTGYRYKSSKKNILTGEIEEDKSTTRIDVIAWEVVVPYAVSDDQTDTDEDAVPKNMTDPVAHKTTEEDHSPERFPVRDSWQSRHADTCLRLHRERTP